MKVYVVTDENFIDSVFINKDAAENRASGVGGYVDEFDTEDRCQTCNFAYVDELGDTYCCNSKSENCTECIEKDDCCDAWEGNQ